MPIAAAFAVSAVGYYCDDAVKSWNDGINIYMIAAGCAACICAGGKTFSSVSWCTRVRPILAY